MLADLGTNAVIDCRAAFVVFSKITGRAASAARDMQRYKLGLVRMYTDRNL